LASLSDASGGERFPDPPWLTEEISAPFDLPSPEPFEPVTLKECERLPLPFEEANGAGS
jgi:hypothetical protein